MPADSAALNEILTWRAHYTEEELQFRRRLLKIDLLGIPVFILWYLVLAYCTLVLNSVISSASPDAGLGQISHQSIVLACLSVCAVIVFVGHTQTLPPKTEDDIFKAMKPIGRWLFLTRHCLTLQAIHGIASLLAVMYQIAWLARLTNCIALWIASLGCFVTVQYFTLVHFNSEIVAKCQECAARNPPYPLRQILIALHAPAIVIAFLDVGIGKDHAALRTVNSLVSTLIINLFYVFFYMTVITLNYRATGFWPYPVLKKLTTLSKWATFVAVQSGVLCIFAAAVWGVSLL